MKDAYLRKLTDRKTTTALAQRTRERKPRRKAQVFTIILAVLVIILSITAFFSWKILTARDNAIQRMIASARNRTHRTAEVMKPIESSASAVSKVGFQTTAVPQPKTPAVLPIQRFEDDLELPTVVTWTPQTESPARYPWDAKEAAKPDEGRLSAGPWQVAAQPRNKNRRSYFSNK